MSLVSQLQWTWCLWPGITAGQRYSGACGRFRPGLGFLASWQEAQWPCGLPPGCADAGAVQLWSNPMPLVALAAVGLLVTLAPGSLCEGTAEAAAVCQGWVDSRTEFLAQTCPWSDSPACKRFLCDENSLFAAHHYLGTKKGVSQ